MNTIERRYFESEPDEVRFIEEENGKRYIEGVAAKYDVKSRPLRDERGNTFIEVIKRGAFTEVLKQEGLDVRALFNHNRNELLGRTSSGTLEVWEDEIGLRYKLEIPNTTLGNDIRELVKRKDIFENSFAFSIAEDGQEFSKDAEGKTLREIKRIGGLYDVSLVTDAAYPSTEVALRELEQWEEKQKEEESKRAKEAKAIYEAINRQIEIYKIK